MRIWDISPGYLNRQSLLGEHRELHGIVSIIVNGKQGYSRHPETLRWAGYGWALRQRHRLLAAEMALRSFVDASPVMTRARQSMWPETYIDDPFRQFQLLTAKYRNTEQGRIPLPKNALQLWHHHKYSVLARDAGLSAELDRKVSAMGPRDDFSKLAKVVTVLLRTPPSAGGMRDALKRMWGHISGCCDTPGMWSSRRLLNEIQRHARASGDSYLISSTALSELAAWLPPR